jgi:hypothetical protein
MQHAARPEAPGRLCATCAALTEAPAVRLGKHERAILRACWDARQAGGDPSHWSEADCCTEALPALIYGLAAWLRWPNSRVWTSGQPQYLYDWEDAQERNRVQATLSRAIRTLYAKGLIDCGGRWEATGHRDERPRREYIKTIRLTHAGQTPPTPVLRLCIIKPTGLSRPSRDIHRRF